MLFEGKNKKKDMRKRGKCERKGKDDTKIGSDGEKLC
jgi:hypothetical protein